MAISTHRPFEAKPIQPDVTTGVSAVAWGRQATRHPVLFRGNMKVPFLGQMCCFIVVIFKAKSQRGPKARRQTNRNLTWLRRSIITRPTFLDRINSLVEYAASQSPHVAQRSQTTLERFRERRKNVRIPVRHTRHLLHPPPTPREPCWPKLPWRGRSFSSAAHPATSNPCCHLTRVISICSAVASLAVAFCRCAAYAAGHAGSK